MSLDPNTRTAIAIVLLCVVYLLHRDDPRAWEWIKAQWANIVGAFFARRRMVASFGGKPRSVFRVSARPDEYIRGIPNSRRDINTGNWT